MLNNISGSSIKLEWETDSTRISQIDINLFNRFFKEKGQAEKMQDLAKQSGQSLSFLLDVTVILSQYLNKLGYLNSVLKIR